MKLFNDDLMRWYICKSRVYHSLPEEKRDSNGCYFLLDTREVILEDTSYSGILLSYSGLKPTHPSQRRLYLNMDDLSVSIWDGTKWILIYSNANAQLISANPAEEEYERVVSGEVVVDYAKRMIIDTIKDYAKFYKLAYNKDTHKIEFHIGEIEGEETVVGISNKILLNSETNRMYLLDSETNILSSFVLFPRNLVAGRVDYETLEIVFDMSDGNPIRIPCAQMFNLLKAESTATMNVSTLDKKRLTMDVIRSQEEDNQLIKLADGVFYTLVSKIDKIQPGFEGAVLGVDNNGGLKILKRRIITSRVEGSNADADSLVTEELVYNTLSSAMNSFAKYTDVWHSNHAKLNIAKAMKVSHL